MQRISSSKKKGRTEVRGLRSEVSFEQAARAEELVRFQSSEKEGPRKAERREVCGQRSVSIAEWKSQDRSSEARGQESVLIAEC